MDRHLTGWCYRLDQISIEEGRTDISDMMGNAVGTGQGDIRHPSTPGD